MKKYDYLVVGSGPYGMIFARELSKIGKKVLIIDKRGKVGGNMSTSEKHGIVTHDYGAHIFHTSDKEIWDYVNEIHPFKSFVNQVIAKDESGKIFNLPFNMNTFYQLWGLSDPIEVQKKIESQRIPNDNPQNLEEQALSLIGKDVYEKLIKGYTEKQWGRRCTDLPPEIIKRLPVRLTFDNNYFNDNYQGVCEGGYQNWFESILEECPEIDVKLSTDYFKDKSIYEDIPKIVFTGMIDEFFDYQFGKLEYRSLKFKSKVLDTENFQANAVVNYPDKNVPYTRVMEWKHFEGNESDKTIITEEYPSEWDSHKIPYYPINNESNQDKYEKYKSLAEKQENVIFGGRLGRYQYLDMDKVVKMALDDVEKEIESLN